MPHPNHPLTLSLPTVPAHPLTLGVNEGSPGGVGQRGVQLVVPEVAAGLHGDKHAGLQHAGRAQGGVAGGGGAGRPVWRVP